MTESVLKVRYFEYRIYNMLYLHIFIDGSVNAQLKIGYGACLILSDLHTPIESLKDNVKVKRFEQTSSTKLELQTLLWALDETNPFDTGNNIALTVYTDSQNIVGLPGRRARLEETNYFSNKKRRLNNYDLYQEFYRLTSELTCEFVKVIGHQPSSKKDQIDKLFSLVDQASRCSLRTHF